MNKSALIAIVPILIASVLAGCNQQSLRADQNNSSSSQIASSQFKAPAKATSNRHYRSNHQLKKPADFTYDQFGTKQTLQARVAKPISAKNKFVAVTITQINTITNQPTTKDATSVAEQALHTKLKPNHGYVTTQISFKVQNKTAQPIHFGGVQALQTKRQVLTAPIAISDNSNGQLIKAHATKRFLVVGVTDKETSLLKMVTNNSTNQAGHPISSALTITNHH